MSAAGGNNALAGGLSAGGAEAAAPIISQYLYGEKDSSKLNAEQKQTLSTLTSLLGASTGAAVGNTIADTVSGSLSANSAVGNNYLTESSLERIRKGEVTSQEAEKLSQYLDDEVKRLCAQNPIGDACRSSISSQIKYIAMKEAWDVMRKDVSRTSKETFDYLYNTEGANNRLVIYMNTIDNRANFFGASNQYEKHLGVGAKWFGGAEKVSRALLTGLGADGNVSYISFGAGKALGNPDLYGWRKEAGDTLITQGFSNFKNLYNNRPNPVQWDIKQLRDEQNLLQPIHEKYLTNYGLFRWVSRNITDSNRSKISYGLGGELINNILDRILDKNQTQDGGIDILDKNSRIRYGCQLLGYTEQQGCKP